MKDLNIDVALTLKVVVPTKLASEYRQLALSNGNVALANLSAELKDDQDFIQRIITDNVKHGVNHILPRYLEQGGIGVTVVPLAVQRADVTEVELDKAE